MLLGELLAALDAVAAEGSKFFGVFVGVGGDDAALSGGDVLDGVEGEAGEVRNGADRLAPMDGAEGVAGVLDEGEAVLICQGAKGREVGRVAGVVHGDDSAGPRCDAVGDVAWGEGEGLGVQVGKNGGGAEVECGVAGGDESEGGGDDLVTRLDAGDCEAGVECSSTGVDGDGMGGTGSGCKFLLEGLDLGAGGEVVGAEDVGDGLDVFIDYALATIGEVRLSDRGGAVDGE